MKLKEFNLLSTPFRIFWKGWSSPWASRKHPSRLRNSRVNYKTQDMPSCLENTTAIYIFLLQHGNKQANLAWVEVLRTKVLLQSENAFLSFLILTDHWWNRKWCKSTRWIRKGSPISIKSTTSSSFFKVFLRGHALLADYGRLFNSRICSSWFNSSNLISKNHLFCSCVIKSWKDTDFKADTMKLKPRKAPQKSWKTASDVLCVIWKMMGVTPEFHVPSESGKSPSSYSNCVRSENTTRWCKIKNKKNEKLEVLIRSMV